MKKHLKIAAWLLSVLMIYSVVIPAAGIGDNSTGGNFTGINYTGGNSTGGNSTGGNSTGVDEYIWGISLGECNITIQGTSSVSPLTLNLAGSESVQCGTDLAAQLSQGPLPTGADTYSRKANDAGYLYTFDLNRDGEADLGLREESYPKYYLEKLSGASFLKGGFTFSYPAPSQNDIVFYNPVTINFPSSALTRISGASVTLTPPAAGTKSKDNMPLKDKKIAAVPSGAHYEAETGCWFNGNDWAEADQLKDFSFEAGKTYKLWVTLKAAGGYGFSQNCKLSVTGGKLVNIEDIYTSGTYSGLAAVFSVTIPTVPDSQTPTTSPTKEPGDGVITTSDKVGYYEIRGGAAVFIKPKKQSAKTLKIPAKVTYNGQSYKVTEIAPNACKGMKKLKTLVIGKNVTTIGAGAFSQCKALKTVTIGKNVTTIGKKAFYQCKALQKLIFKGKKLKKVGSKAISRIASVPTVKCPKGTEKKYEKLLKKGGLKKAKYTK